MIRRPCSDDRKDLLDFFTLMIRDTYTKEGVGHLEEDIENEIHSKMLYLKQDFDTEGRDHYFLILEKEGSIIGSAALGKPSPLIVDYLPQLKSSIELGSVFIHPDYQGMGYGKKLLEKILENVETYCLDSGYKRAQKIWTHMFGQPCYIVKDLWGIGSDHYIWYKI